MTGEYVCADFKAKFSNGIFSSKTYACYDGHYITGESPRYSVGGKTVNFIDCIWIPGTTECQEFIFEASSVDRTIGKHSGGIGFVDLVDIAKAKRNLCQDNVGCQHTHSLEIKKQIFGSGHAFAWTTKTPL